VCSCIPPFGGSPPRGSSILHSTPLSVGEGGKNSGDTFSLPSFLKGWTPPRAPVSLTGDQETALWLDTRLKFENKSRAKIAPDASNHSLYQV